MSLYPTFQLISLPEFHVAGDLGVRNKGFYHLQRRKQPEHHCVCHCPLLPHSQRWQCGPRQMLACSVCCIQERNSEFQKLDSSEMGSKHLATAPKGDLTFITVSMPAACAQGQTLCLQGYKQTYPLFCRERPSLILKRYSETKRSQCLCSRDI